MKKTSFLNSLLMLCLKVEIYYCDNRISFLDVHSCMNIAFVTIRAPVLTFIVVRWFEQIEFGTRNKTVHRRGAPPTRTWYFGFLLMYATSSIVNDFYIPHS